MDAEGRPVRDREVARSRDGSATRQAPAARAEAGTGAEDHSGVGRVPPAGAGADPGWQRLDADPLDYLLADHDADRDAATASRDGAPLSRIPDAANGAADSLVPAAAGVDGPVNSAGAIAPEAPAARNQGGRAGPDGEHLPEVGRETRDGAPPPPSPPCPSW
jgi:hypothetical protein